MSALKIAVIGRRHHRTHACRDAGSPRRVGAGRHRRPVGRGGRLADALGAGLPVLVEKPLPESVGAAAALVQAVAAMIREGVPPLVGPWDGLRNMMVLEAVRRSAGTGRAVAVARIAPEGVAMGAAP